MTYLAVPLEVLLVAWLPGALLLRLPVADRPRRAALAPEERLFWAVIIAIAWSSLVALILAAAGRYSLGRLLLVNALLSTAIIGIWRTRLRLGAEAAPPRGTAVIPIVLVALGAFLFFPPAEHVIGGKDPGVYVNEGIQIAQRGGLIVHDETVATVPARVRDLFFPSHANPTYYSIRFMGFRILDPAEGTIIGQFPHLYPAWIAIGYGIGGLSGALRTTGWWAILGLVALYTAGRRVTGTAAAGAAAVLLGVSVVQIWFARDPNSEVVAQPLLLAAIAAFTRAHVDRDRFFGPVAGVLLGLLLFLRLFDAAIAIAGIGLALVVQLLDGRRPQLGFLGAAAGVGAPGVIYLTRWMAAYWELPATFLENLRPLQLALAGGGVLVVAAIALAARSPAVRAPVRAAVPSLFAVAVIGGAVYAYFFRVPAGRLAWHDAASLRTFTWYLPPAGLAAAVAGYAFFAWRRFWPHVALLTTLAVSSFVVFYKIRVVPEHFWMTRRFLPLILPGALLLLCGLAFVALTRRRADVPMEPGAGRRWLMGLAVPLLFVGLVGAALARQSRPVLPHVEYAGVLPRLEALAARFTRDDLLLVESRNASDLHVLALPLAYVYDRQVLVLNTPKPDRLMFREFLRWAHSRYGEVYFLGGGGTDLLSRSTAATPIASVRFQVPEYESPRNAFPTGVRFKEFDFGIYRLERQGSPAAGATLDIGTLDDLNVVRFHAKERMGDTTFRWTRDVSYLSLPGLDSGTRSITLWLNDGRRPAAAGRARIQVFLDDQPLGDASVGPGFAPYVFPVPSALAQGIGRRDDPALVRIVSNTWSPHQLLGTPDDRQLGVMLDRVEIR